MCSLKSFANHFYNISVYGPGQFMNPGPAPRPPTDRPRLNFTPSTTNIPGNVSTTSLQSPSMRSLSTTSFNSALSRQATLVSDILREGFVKVKGGGLGTFSGFMLTKKWLVLKPPVLEFCAGDQGKVLWTLPLANITSIHRSEVLPLTIDLIYSSAPVTTAAMVRREPGNKFVQLKLDEDNDLYEWQDAIYNNCPAVSGVSNPTNFTHRVHVGFDQNNGNFVGLPPEWEKLLTTSALTKEDQRKNPEVVLEVLDFYSNIQKRAQNMDEYSSLMPTPPINTGMNMQLGHGGGGTSVAPPRPIPPMAAERQGSTPPRSQNGTPIQNQRKPSGSSKGYEQQENNPPVNDISLPSKLTMNPDMRRAMEEEAKRVKEKQEHQERQRAREELEQNRQNTDAYNGAIPKQNAAMAQLEIGERGPSSDSSARFNPNRAAPSAPNSDRARQPPQGSLRQPSVSRQAAASSAGGMGASVSAIPRSPFQQGPSVSRDQSPGSQSSLRTPARPPPQQRQESPNARQASSERNQSPHTRGPPHGAQTNGNSSSSRFGGPAQSVKPLNVATKAANVAPVNKQQVAAQPSKSKPADGIKEISVPIKSAAETRQKEVRMSSMSESEVMSKLKHIVTKYDPLASYVKQRKIGQGASGSVYIAKVLAEATSPVAKSVYKKDGGEARVAIKTMDLRNQPRKELIVNEIIVMKESLHPNIVNYLDSFLIENDTELWVIMEYMNGGALTDVIENNSKISEDQIAAICREVSFRTSTPQYIYI